QTCALPIYDGVEDVDVGLLGAGAARRDLAETERAAEQSAHRFIERPRERVGVRRRGEVVARAGGHAVIAREADGAGGTRGLALAAEQAAAEVERELAVADGDG